MKRRLLFHLLLALGGIAPAVGLAAPLTRDLGQDLAYYRVAALPADLPTAEATRKKSCVLDLRYARGDAAAGTALDGWLKFHAATRTPVFLLVNSATDAALLAPLAARLPAHGLVLIGSAAPGLTPDLALKIAPDEERRAYDALAAGATAESLLNDTPEKARNDEARLAKDHQGQPDPTTSPRPSDDPFEDAPPADAAADKSAKPKPPAPLIDTALQRAVQLHRSLKALKRL